MYVTSHTDQGLVRKENQDRVRTDLLGDSTAVAVVCDGMGGAAHGSEASQTAIEIIFERLTENYRPGMSFNSIRNLLLTSIGAANAVVYRKSTEESEKAGMGTTCVAVLATADTAFVASVGDSRAYRIDDDGITQITVDHTYVEMLLEQGQIDKDTVRSHSMRNVITKAVGVEPEVEADYFEIELTEHSVVLLCSDGLTSCCTDEEILQTIRENNGDAAQALVELAKRNSSSDNITVAFIYQEDSVE